MVMMPVVGGVRISVAAQFLVPSHLLLGEDGEHLEMGVQVDGPEFASELPDLIGKPEERLPVQMAVAEAPLQVLFRLYDLSPQLGGSLPHILEERLRGLQLLGGELEPFRLLEDVERPGNAVEFRGEGHPEPGSLKEALDLGRTQGADLPVLQGRVGVVLTVLRRGGGLGRGGGWERQKGEDDKKMKASHVKSFERWTFGDQHRSDYLKPKFTEEPGRSKG